MLVLLLVFLIQATSSAQTAEYTQSFESYDIGTSAADIENVYSYGVWDNATVVDGGPGASKELCVTPGLFLRVVVSSLVALTFYPRWVRFLVEAGVSFDFRIQSGTTTPTASGTRLAGGGIFESASNYIWMSLHVPNNGNDLYLFMGDGSGDPSVSSIRPFDDLGFDLDSPGEFFTANECGA